MFGGWHWLQLHCKQQYIFVLVSKVPAKGFHHARFSIHSESGILNLYIIVRTLLFIIRPNASDRQGLSTQRLYPSAKPTTMRGLWMFSWQSSHNVYICSPHAIETDSNNHVGRIRGRKPQNVFMLCQFVGLHKFVYVHQWKPCS